ncbi:uncharacterized protein LOC131219623 [Magnolia sinica]|uniref:uncharacterized protein LOC131219623 n=1 Tax=Magnolia sinica TaxID=86752 RepID=UPI002658AF9B|nr:uncharacterized protein LOC131219623 [Magnolia sinica]
MSKTDDPERNIPWGTWEELLLACAVNRHGTKNWDSVAMEIQNRTSSPLILTAQNCKQKYLDLQRRFVAVDDKTDGGDDESEKDDKKKIPWLEELRKLRVAELRREVQRYDVSIVSLQLKVKKLKEERERSLEETENGDEKADLAKEETKNEGDTEKEKDGEDDRSSPENVDGKRISGEDSDRENQSFNESNSTDPKDKQRETEGEKRPEDDAGTTAGKPDPASGESPEEKAVGEGSYNGSSDTVAKGTAAAKSPAPTPAPDTGESAEFRESVAESKGEGVEGAKESSDVQSSASLSRKRRRRKAISGSSSGEEPEADDVSPVSKRIPVKSQPLVGFLEIIRSHKHGSVFERRLECQEGGDYQSMIRQHVDLEMVRTKLEEGLYADGSLEFFRDLLLLFNNAIVFFPKNSSEQAAATALRAVVSKEMARSIPKPYTLSKERTPPPRPQPSLPKPNSEPSISLPGKPNSTGPLIACRKRSSISSKAHPAVAAEVKRKEAVEIDRKPDAADLKEPDNSSANMVVEPRVTKKRSMDRSAPRGTRTSKTRSNNINVGARTSNPSVNPNPSPSSNSNAAAAAKAGGSNESSDGKAEKKNSNSASVAKKRSAANFLNRMKRSLSSNGTLLETLKGSVGNGSGSNSRGAEQKKGGRGDSRRDQGHRQASVGKQVQEQSSPVAAKRSVGRPPKRATAAAAAASAPPSRRGKDAVEAEAKPPPRKRARR